MVKKHEEKLTQNPITVRAIAVYEALKRNGKFLTQEDFCKKVDFNQSSLSQVLKGNRQFPQRVVSSIIEHYDVRPDYIYKGVAPMFNKEYKVKTEPMTANEPDLKNQLIEVLKENIKLKDEIIETLKKNKGEAEDDRQSKAS